MTMNKISPNPNDSQTLITLQTLSFKVEHICHINPTLKKQVTEKRLEKHNLRLPHKLEQLGAHSTKTDKNKNNKKIR
jgi:hypothetical protein